MYPVSAGFLAAAVSGDHRIGASVDVTLDGAVVATLAFEDGSVGMDGRRDGPQRTLALTVTPVDWVWALLNTPGIEFVVRRGLEVNGSMVMVPLGVFVLDCDLEQQDEGAVSLNGADRSVRISRNRWRQPYTVPAGTDLGTAIGGILEDRWQSVTLGFGELGIVTTAQLVCQPGSDSDPWKDARALAADHGFELYFDGTGTARLMPIVDPSAITPCMTYHGGELSVVLSKRRRSTISQVRNGVVASGEGSDVTQAVQAEAWDDDPQSPTFRYGPMGHVPGFYSSPLLTTAEMCEAAAATRLAKVKGRGEQLAWDMIVNPAHEPFDVIVFEGSRYTLDEISIPLTASGSMGATAREVRVA